MPTPASAILLVALNGGAPASGGITAANGDTVQLSAQSTTGWTQQRYDIYSFYSASEFPLPAGWSLDGVTGAYYYSTSATPPSFTLPAATAFGKWLLRLTANNGLNSAGATDATLVDSSTALTIPSAAGLSDLAWDEEGQFSTAKKWVEDQQANLRVLEAAVVGAASPGGTVSTSLATAGTAGALATYSRSDHRHQVSTAAPSNIGTANAIGSSAALARADHVHDHGAQTSGSLHALAAPAGAAGFLSGSFATDLTNATPTATASTLAKRGASSECAFAALTCTSLAGPATAATTGLIRCASNTSVIKGRNAANSANASLLAWDSADGISIGENTNVANLDMTCAVGGQARIIVGSTKCIVAAVEGVQFGGDPSFGGGSGVLGITDTSVPPGLLAISGGVVVYSYSGALTCRSPNGVVTTMAPVGSSSSGTTKILDRLTGYATTNATTATVIIFTIPAATTVTTIHLSVMGWKVDSAFHAERVIRAKRIAGAAAVIQSLTPTGVADNDEIGGCSIAVSASGTGIIVEATSGAGATAWFASGWFDIFTP